MPLPPTKYKCLMCGSLITVTTEFENEGNRYRISEVINHEDPMQEDCYILMRVITEEKKRLLSSVVSRASQKKHGS